MNNSFFKHDITYEKANEFILSLLLLFPILPIHLNNYVIGFVMLFAVIGLFVKSYKPVFRLEKSWIITGSFLVLLISMLYTINASAGFFEIEKRAAMVVFPVIFLLRGRLLPKKTVRFYEYVFISVILIFFTWVNINIIISAKQIISEGRIVSTWHDVLTNEQFAFFYRRLFQKFSNIHPTYACIYSLFALGILIIQFLNGEFTNKLKLKIVNALIVLILLIYSLFLAAKGPLLAFIISMVVVLFIKLKRIHFYIISSALVSIFIVAIVVLPPLKDRINEVFHPNRTEVISSVSIRKIIFKSSLQLIKEDGLFGVGVGDVQDNLNRKYQPYHEDKFTTTSYNTHNEYFNLLLSAGVIGIISLLLTLIFPLIAAIKKNQTNLIFFILFISICFLFENILSRQKGILFFTIFYMIYYVHLIDNQKKCQQDTQNI